MTVPVWVTPISMVAYTVLLMLLTEFMRRHYRTSMWVWVVSLVTIPLWIANIPGDDWCRWAKNLSVILPLIFGIDGIWFSVTVAEMFACAIAACFMIGLSGHYGYRKQKKLPAENPLPPQP